MQSQDLCNQSTEIIKTTGQLPSYKINTASGLLLFFFFLSLQIYYDIINLPGKLALNVPLQNIFKTTGTILGLIMILWFNHCRQGTVNKAEGVSRPDRGVQEASWSDT